MHLAPCTGRLCCCLWVRRPLVDDVNSSLVSAVLVRMTSCTASCIARLLDAAVHKSISASQARTGADR